MTSAGGGTVTLGIGGGWNSAIRAYDTGSEAVNLIASTAVSDTLRIADGVVSASINGVGGVTAFQITPNAATSDVIAFSAGPTNPAIKFPASVE